MDIHGDNHSTAASSTLTSPPPTTCLQFDGIVLRSLSPETIALTAEGLAQLSDFRLAKKLEAIRGTGDHVPLAEEFRHLTLQVIGEAILSMSHEEADKVFPLLYLPIMEEANKRSLRPWREYMPNAEWFAHRRRIARRRSARSCPTGGRRARS